jgi:uncharacterized membrane protein HdeD (DUF308 family)
MSLQQYGKLTGILSVIAGVVILGIALSQPNFRTVLWGLFAILLGLFGYFKN